jgi:hypothetical protein
MIARIARALSHRWPAAVAPVALGISSRPERSRQRRAAPAGQRRHHSDQPRAPTGPKLAADAITARALRHGTLLRADFKAGQLPSAQPGPPGPAGPAGAPGVVVSLAAGSPGPADARLRSSSAAAAPAGRPGFLSLASGGGSRAARRCLRRSTVQVGGRPFRRARPPASSRHANVSGREHLEGGSCVVDRGRSVYHRCPVALTRTARV